MAGSEVQKIIVASSDADGDDAASLPASPTRSKSAVTPSLSHTNLSLPYKTNGSVNGSPAQERRDSVSCSIGSDGSEHKQRSSTSSPQTNGRASRANTAPSPSPAAKFSSASRTYSSASSRRTSRGTISRTGSDSEMSVINSRMDSVAAPPAINQRPIDRFGFEVPDDANERRSSIVSPKTRKQKLRRENLRLQKWVAMLQDWKKYVKRNPKKVKERIRKGIPDPLRGKVWYSLSNAQKYRDEKPNLYQECLHAEATEMEAVIIRDLDRTFPKHVLFKNDQTAGQDSLYNVLKAFSVYDKEVGYCQGMGFVTGLMLMYMGEEEAFWVLVALMRGKYSLRGMYSPGLPGLLKRFHQMERLLHRFAPRLANHLEQLHVPTMMYSSQWFITVFAHSLPFELVVRVYDVFFSEGYKIIFRIGLALMLEAEAELLKLDFEDIPPTLKTAHKRFAQRPDDVLKAAFKLPLKRKDIDKLGAEYEKQHEAAAKERAARRSARSARSRSTVASPAKNSKASAKSAPPPQRQPATSAAVAPVAAAGTGDGPTSKGADSSGSPLSSQTAPASAVVHSPSPNDTSSASDKTTEKPSLNSVEKDHDGSKHATSSDSKPNPESSPTPESEAPAESNAAPIKSPSSADLSSHTAPSDRGKASSDDSPADSKEMPEENTLNAPIS